MTKEEKIRKELSGLLTKTPVNYSRVLELSSQLADLDENFTRFTVDAGIIDRLGKELVARPETAVSELIKNSYDADGTNVTVIFEKTENPGGVLIIEDDGDGMNKEQLVNGFMKISATTKIHEPLTEKFKRKRAGRKGIGRFAVQRLGTGLIITTQTKHSDKAIRLSIDWEDYKSDRNLTQVSNRIEFIKKERQQGTTLEISNLRDTWTESAIKKIFRYVIGILQPYPLSKTFQSGEDRRLKSTKDLGFKVSFFKKDGKRKDVIANEDLLVLNYAAATIEGFVDSNGKGSYKVTSTKLRIKKNEKLGIDENNKINWKYIKNIHFKAFYFIYHNEFIPSQQKTAIQELAEEIGGIRLYNNGFRVLPYGEPFVDWLKLDQSVRKRQVLPPHGNNNFFGFVEVTDASGLLEETSSREGLRENAAFVELQNFVFKGLIGGVREVARVRGQKEIASQKNWKKKKAKPNIVIKDAANQISDAADLLESRKGTDKGIIRTLRKYASNIIEAAKEQQEEESKLIEELAMVRILASLGLSIGEFTHEIRHYLGSLEAKTKLMAKNANPKTSAGKEIIHLRDNIHKLRVYASYYDRTIAENIVRDLAPQNISVIIMDFFDVMNPDIKRNSLQIDEPDIEEEKLMTVDMHPSEIVSILFNLYTNSKKAVIRAEVRGKIHLKAFRENEKILVDFSDNGDGILPKNRDKIFDAFFTTSSPPGLSSTEQEDVTGTGLGLKIVRDILASYGGDINLVKPPKGYTTCFRIEFPANKTSNDS